MRSPAAGLDRLDHGATEVAAVRYDVTGQSERRDRLRRRCLVGGLARSEDQAHRQPAPVYHGMDLGAQPSTGATDGVIRAPLFPPAACWWARTMELSIRCREPGERSASASNTRSQTPAFAHRL